MLDDITILNIGLYIADPNHKYSAVVDFSREANQYRFFIIDVQNKRIDERLYVSHGSGSGSLKKAVSFSNISGSHQSSLGLMRCAETYFSKRFNGIAMRIDGLDPVLNSNVRDRAIVAHRSLYVDRERISKFKEYPGRSQGCFAFDIKDSDRVINKLKGGSKLFVTDGLHMPF